MKKILVIGGNGFIGKNVVDLLLMKKYQVGVYDTLQSAFANVTSYVGDIINDSDFETIIGEYDTIVYLISAIMPKQSMDEPLSSYSNDIPLLIKTLEVCRRHGVGRVIYASSGGTIYGDNTNANKEEMLSHPINHYAICKLTCENILMLYNQLYGMKNIVLRIANPFGKYQRIASGVGAVTTFTYHLLKKEPINIWGDGENVRDYIDVKHVAEAFSLAIELKSLEGIHPIFNVGSGVGYSLNSLVQIISEELGVKPQVEYLSNRNFDVQSNYLDMTKTKQVLGLKLPENPEDNIREYVRYCKKMMEQ